MKDWGIMRDWGIFIIGCIGFLGLRSLTLLVLGYAIQIMYLTANSKSMYKKTKLAAKARHRLYWFTRLCFWNAKTRDQTFLRILIVWRVFAICMIVLFAFWFPTLGRSLSSVEYKIVRFTYVFDVISIWTLSVWAYGHAYKKK